MTYIFWRLHWPTHQLLPNDQQKLSTSPWHNRCGTTSCDMSATIPPMLRTSVDPFSSGIWIQIERCSHIRSFGTENQADFNSINSNVSYLYKSSSKIYSAHLMEMNEVNKYTVDRLLAKPNFVHGFTIKDLTTAQRLRTSWTIQKKWVTITRYPGKSPVGLMDYNGLSWIIMDYNGL